MGFILSATFTFLVPSDVSHDPVGGQYFTHCIHAGHLLRHFELPSRKNDAMGIDGGRVVFRATYQPPPDVPSLMIPAPSSSSLIGTDEPLREGASAGMSLAIICLSTATVMLLLVLLLRAAINVISSRVNRSLTGTFIAHTHRCPPGAGPTRGITSDGAKEDATQNKNKRTIKATGTAQA